MLRNHLTELENLGFHFVGPHTHTYYSHGHFNDGSGTVIQRCSTLDHVYALGSNGMTVSTIPYAATDHRPVLASFPLQPPTLGVREVKARNHTALGAGDLLFVLNAGRLSKVFHCNDVNVIHGIIVEEITTALDSTTPYKTSLIKGHPVPLHLKPDTLRALRERDMEAKLGGDRHKYRALRNKVVRDPEEGQAGLEPGAVAEIPYGPKEGLVAGKLRHQQGEERFPPLLPGRGVGQCRTGSACQQVLR